MRHSGQVVDPVDRNDEVEIKIQKNSPWWIVLDSPAAAGSLEQ